MVDGVHGRRDSDLRVPRAARILEARNLLAVGLPVHGLHVLAGPRNRRLAGLAAEDHVDLLRVEAGGLLPGPALEVAPILVDGVDVVPAVADLGPARCG